MNKDNLIKIKGGSYDDIKKALQQWIMLYSRDLESNIKFELYKIGQENYLIAADKRLNNEKFNFLINYLRYPEGINYNISIEGYSTVRDEKLYPKNLLNKKIIVYVPDNDKEYDNVFVTTEDNETFKIDFGGKVMRQNESKTFFIQDIDTTLLQRPEKIVLNKQELAEIEKERSEKNLKKRFRIVLALIIIVAAINSLSLFVIPHSEIATISTFILVFFVGAWFHWDYKMLRTDKYSIYSFIVAIVDLFYGLLIREHLSDNDIILYYGFYFPVIYLIVQKPLRLFFIRKFDREPIIERDSSLWDGAYGIALIILTVGIVSIIANLT
jgi:hypothetical protein